MFLGHLITAEGFKSSPVKVKAIQEFPLPKTIEELRRFLGLVNSYRRLLPHTADSQRLLHAFTEKAKKKDKRPVPWTEPEIAAFEKCKADVADLAFTSFLDDKADLRLTTDASDTAMGAALEQLVDNTWKPLAFFSKKFNNAQCKYAACDRELSAIYKTVRHFQHYPEGMSFNIYTDHKPLIFAFQQNADKMPPIRARRLSYLAQFNTEILYLPDKDNDVVDALSRINTFTAPTIFNWDDSKMESDEKLQRIQSNVEAFKLPTLFYAQQLSLEQEKDAELQQILRDADHPLKLRKLTWGAVFGISL